MYSDCRLALRKDDIGFGCRLYDLVPFKSWLVDFLRMQVKRNSRSLKRRENILLRCVLLILLKGFE